MIRLLGQALEAARNLPPAAQNDIARVVLLLAGNDDAELPMALSPEERSAIAASKATAARGELATDEQVRAAWAILLDQNLIPLSSESAELSSASPQDFVQLALRGRGEQDIA